MDGIVHILWIMMVTREQLSENRVFDRTRPEYKESAKIALSEGLITDFSDSLGGQKAGFSTQDFNHGGKNPRSAPVTVQKTA